jgi:hypothetical protein
MNPHEESVPTHIEPALGDTEQEQNSGQDPEQGKKGYQEKHHAHDKEGGGNDGMPSGSIVKVAAHQGTEEIPQKKGGEQETDLAELRPGLVCKPRKRRSDDPDHETEGYV